ncbi:MAG TPA: hypothetical protein VNG90_04375 [Candidatus Acidoferrum sp.]|nr:hypothetical protein [Candidatus Acidoferrum sp.]
MKYENDERLARLDKISRAHLPALWQAIDAAGRAKRMGKLKEAEAALDKADKIIRHLDGSIDYVIHAQQLLDLERIHLPL